MVRAAFAAVPMIPASAEIAHAEMRRSRVSTDGALLNVPSLFIFILIPSTDNYVQADEELYNDD